MNAKEMLKEIKRMCESYSCEDCPFLNEEEDDCYFAIGFVINPSNWSIKED